MAPSATTPELPPLSAIQESLNASKSSFAESSHPAYLHHLAATIFHDLQFSHDWTSLEIHTHSPLNKSLLPRPIISGLPPKRIYIHPDEQVEILKAEHETGETIPRNPEREWILPSQIQENWSLAKFAAVFDALSVVPLGKDYQDEDEQEELSVGKRWQGENRQKRLLLATVHDDSTVVYYIMHDGIVKPRQN